VILIDYPGFNFRLFKFIKEHHFKLFYYISPQLWAWKTGRVKKVKQYVDRMFVIFPFEKEFYAKHGVEVDFIGHPLLDEGPTQTLPKGEGLNTIQAETSLTFAPPLWGGREGPIIALLPGSRRQEISKLLPEYLKIISLFPEYKFVIAGISGLGRDFYQSIIGNTKAEIEWDNTYGLLAKAEAAIVTSGTATLETALFNVPEVVCYRSSPISYFIAKQLVKGIEYICIVNLIAGKKIVTELIQDEVNPANLKKELSALLDDAQRQNILRGYAEVRGLLGKSGASARAADLMLGYLQK